jgi:hypothetical protein
VNSQKIFFFRLSKILFLYFIYSTLPMVAANIGSDTNVNAYTTQQKVYANDRIASFAALIGGFKIFDLGSTTTFDSFFPVSGDIDLQAGTLVLNKDLTTQDTVFFSPGNIIGNKHSLDFAQTVSQIPKLSAVQAACSALVMGTNPTIPNSAQVLSCDFSRDSQFVALGCYRTNNPTSSRGTNVTIYQVDFSNPTNPVWTQQVTTAGLSYANENIMNLIRWHPMKYVLAVALKTASGTKELRIFLYDGATSLTEVTQTSIPDFGVACYAVAWHPSGDYLAIAKASSPYIQVYAFDQNTNTLGSVVASSTTAYVTSTKALDWDPTGNYLAIGYNAAPYMTIFKFTPTGFTQTITPAVGTFTGTVNALRWHPLIPNLLGVATAAGTNSIRVVQFDPDTQTITNYALATESNIYLAVDWGACSNCLSAARAATTNNHRLFTFTQSPPTLTGNTAFTTLGSNLIDTRYDPSGQWFIDTSNASAIIARYAMNGRCTNPMCRTFTDLNIYLNSDLYLRDCCLTFAGNCSIIGHNKHLSMSRTCTLQIAAASTLTLKDISVDTMNGTRINCLGNSSTLSLSNATLNLDGDYTFSSGSLTIANNVNITGPTRTFLYSSKQPCTIATQSTLALANGLTFNYNPQTPSATKLQFADNTAQLALYGATLNASQNLQLIKGTILVDNSSQLTGPGTITFSDGLSSTNNATVHILPAAQLITTGNVTLADA